MTSGPSQRPVSALRARMIEDMTVRGFNEHTRSGYVRHVRAFAAFIGRSPDTATAEDLRLFQLHQRAGGTCKGKEQRQVWTRKSLRCPTRGLGQVGKPGLGRGATTLMPRAGCYPG